MSLALKAIRLIVLLALVRDVSLLQEQFFQCWVISSLDRVAAGEVPRGSRTATLWAARGEYEAFQIVVQPLQSGVSLLRVELSDLKSGAGHAISRSNLTLYREHFVNVDRPSPEWRGVNRPRGPGRYPDALIPFSSPGGALRALPISLTSPNPQVIWVDVFVPRDTPAGAYTGTITLVTNKAESDVAVTLTVWGFQLPVRPALKSSFSYWSEEASDSAEELLRHKIMPRHVSRDLRSLTSCKALRTLQSDWVERFGLSAADSAFWSGADRDNCSMRSPPSIEELRAAVKCQYPGIALYNYTADEITVCRNLASAIKQWTNRLRAAGIKNLVVMTPTPELLGGDGGRSAVDIWVVLPSEFDRTTALIQRALANGDEIWSYSALAQDDYSPKWLIDYDPINLRIHAGFLSQSLRLTGLLYWRVDRWSSDPWNNVNNVGAFGPGNYPGEGLLVYPGKAVGLRGVVPSMRLKQLRDGVEDYEYVEILKSLGYGDWALSVTRIAAPNWRDWTHQPHLLAAARKQLGEAIQHLLKEKGEQGPPRRLREPSGSQ